MSEPETPQPPSDPPPPPSDPPPPPSDPPPPSSTGGSDSQNTVMLVLSYLGILALIPFLVEKEDKEVQWHAKHGLVLLVAEFVIFIGLFFVSFILGAVSGGLGCLVTIVQPFLFIAILILHIICIVKAVNGQRFLVPGVSQYADKF